MNENNFIKLASVDVSDKIDKKGNLSYLSWPFAIDQLMRHDQLANWEFHDPVFYGETVMVSCTVTAFGKPIKMHLPVMDHRNQAIKNPDAFQINKNMMRCLVKTIACHGLGLHIYAGEDLPMNEEGQIQRPEPTAQKQQPPQQAPPKPVNHAPTNPGGLSDAQIKMLYARGVKLFGNPTDLKSFVKQLTKKDSMKDLNRPEFDLILKAIEDQEKVPR
jgi:hypothetical protein